MMTKLIRSPLKTHGGKSRLLRYIKELSGKVRFDEWVEPFVGSGVVWLNMGPGMASIADKSKHIAYFFKGLQNGSITPNVIESRLLGEGELLLERGAEHYYKVRERFNKDGDPFDYLFLTRTCFNGVIRFNQAGGFNVPFCKEPGRMNKNAIDSVIRNIDAVIGLFERSRVRVNCQDFEATIGGCIGSDPLIYCDPPYIGLESKYIDGWSERDERRLYSSLKGSRRKFIFSTWIRKGEQLNPWVERLWGEFKCLEVAHRYVSGPKAKNRPKVTEGFFYNF